MSVPFGSTGPSFTLDHQLRYEIMAHRAKVFAALSQHSDPALREIGRLLAHGTVTPYQLLDDPQHAETLSRTARKLTEIDAEDLCRQVFGPAAPPSGPTSPPSGPGSGSGTPSSGHTHAGHSHGAGPASRADHTDPDNGAGGVPAVRR